MPSDEFRKQLCHYNHGSGGCSQVIVQMEHDSKQEWGDVMIVPAGSLAGQSLAEAIEKRK